MEPPPFIDFHNHRFAAPPPPEDVLEVDSTPAAFLRNAPPPRLRAFRTLEFHPWFTAETAALPPDFAELAARPEVIAIGEAGLDKNRGAPPDRQRERFREVVQIAEAVKKPLVIHCVGCHSELLAERKNRPWRVPTMIHYFCGKPELAAQLWRHGWMLSLSPRSLENARLAAALRADHSLLDRIVLETDDPDSGNAAAHYRAAAERFSIPLAELRRIMADNFTRFFGFSPLPGSGA